MSFAQTLYADEFIYTPLEADLAEPYYHVADNFCRSFAPRRTKLLSSHTICEYFAIHMRLWHQTKIEIVAGYVYLQLDGIGDFYHHSWCRFEDGSIFDPFASMKPALLDLPSEMFTRFAPSDHLN